MSSLGGASVSQVAPWVAAVLQRSALAWRAVPHGSHAIQPVIPHSHSAFEANS